MRTATAFPFLLFIGLICSSTSPAQQKIEGLLAEPYPGSVLETNLRLGGTGGSDSKAVVEARGRTFYSKDPIEKVKAHYTRQFGEFEDASGADHVYRREIVPFTEVVKIVAKKGGEVGEGGDNFYGGTYAGVTLSAPMNNPNVTVNKVFDELLHAYLLRFQNGENVELTDLAKHAEDPELKQIQSRYEHLKWSYFMQANEKDSLDKGRSTDEVVYDKYFVAPEKDRQHEIEELQKKMTAATTQMKYDEAAALGNRLTKLAIGPEDPKEKMDIAMKCLQEMDINAYATKIDLDMHPSKWVINPSGK